MWFAFVPVYAISVAIFFVASRYRLPLLIAFAVCAAGVVHVRRASQVIATLIAGAIALLPFGLDSGRSQEQASMVVWLIEHHRGDDAMRLMKQVEPQNNDVARLHHRAAMAYAQQQDLLHAAALYEQVLRDPVAQPVLRQDALAEAVRIYAHTGRNRDDAIRLLKAADPQSLTPMFAAKVGHDAMQIGDVDDALRFLAIGGEPYDLGTALIMRGRFDEAIDVLRRAPADRDSQLMLGIAYSRRAQLTHAGLPQK